MRLFKLFVLICLLSLSGCINYYGIKSQSRPYDAQSLAVHHKYTPKNTKAFTQNNWWNKFHDPQLNALIEVALADSPTMKTAQNRVNLAQNTTDESKSALFPSLKFDSLVAREHLTENTIYPPNIAGNTVSYGFAALNFTYDFDFWGKNQNTVAANVDETYATKADKAAARLMISSAVATAYYQLQSNIALLLVAEDIAKQREDLEKIVISLVTHNIQSEVPLSQATADTRSSHISVANVKQAVLLSRHQLAILMGKNPFTTTIKVRPFAYNASVLSLPTVIPANLLGRRPDIVASRWRVEAASHQICASKANFYPDINLKAFFSYQSIGLNKLFLSSSQDKNVRAAIDLPIFDANQRRAQLSEKYSEYDIAVNQYNDTILTALKDSADQISRIYVVKSQQASQVQVLKNIQNTYNLIQARYNHGISDYTQLLQAKGALLSEKQRDIQLKAQRVLTTIAMIKALGGDYQSKKG